MVSERGGLSYSKNSFWVTPRERHRAAFTFIRLGLLFALNQERLSISGSALAERRKNSM
jgi:hypothetical protein